MSLNASELAYAHQPVSGDEALAIIDMHRGAFDDQTRLEYLSDELPYYARHYGLTAVKLLNLSDNSAGAFKWRGAVVAMDQLVNQGSHHVIAPSAGNHARGAALAARQYEMLATIAVPRSAPPAKRERIHELWPSHKLDVHVTGATFDDSLQWALMQPGDMLHPYDDLNVVAGQGTVVDDLLASDPGIKHIVTPVGGAGLTAGILQRLDEHGREDVTVHAVQAYGSNSLSKSLARDILTPADNPNALYGGSAVRRIGQYTFDICRTRPNLQVHTVSDADVAELVNSYDHSRQDLLRTDTPNYERTTLVGMTALKNLSHLTGTVCVLGTGQNEALHAAPSRRDYSVSF